MKNLLGKSKHFTAGLMAGIILMTAVPVLAESGTIQAFMDDTIKLFIGGESMTLPADYKMLTYNGYTYLPSRYVAEQLGATVSWDEGARAIRITPAPPKEVEKIVEVPVEVEKIVYVEKEVTESYRNLPITESEDDVSIKVINLTNIGLSSSGTSFTKVSCDVENTSNQDNLIVLYGQCVLTADGKEYKTSDTLSNNYDHDMQNREIKPGDTYNGFIVFPLIDETSSKFTIEVPVRNQSTSEITTITVNFSATIKKS